MAVPGKGRVEELRLRRGEELMLTLPEGEMALPGARITGEDLETVLDTVDKSSIFRTLEVFEKHHAVHSIDDGTGSIKFEVCEGGTDCTVSDMHTHFYCEKCHRTYCLKDINVPVVNLPEGFEMHSVNYIVKGICPGCR